MINRNISNMERIDTNEVKSLSTLTNDSKSANEIELEMMMQKPSVTEENNKDNESDGLKRIAPSIIFDVAMPSIDVYSDFSLIVGWYWYHHWKYALSMTMPLVLQFLASIFKWIRLEKRESKKWSWPILMLQFWPQWRALRIIHLDYKNDEKTGIKKKELMQEVNSAEPFLEAWPSIVIMTVIFTFAASDKSFSLHCISNAGYFANSTIPNQSPLIIKDHDCPPLPICNATNAEGCEHLFHLDLPTKYCANNPGNNKCSVFGGLGGSKWFLTTYFISIISAAFGITRFLQIGPLSMLNDEGPLHGICTWRFIIAFLAVITSMFCKALLMVLFISPLDDTEISEKSISMWLEGLSAAFAIFVLPNIIFSIICFTYSIGVNRKLIELILSYPASWMLPVATNFAIGPRRSLCKSKANHHRHQLAFSTKCTILNIILTLLMYRVAYYIQTTVYFKIIEKENCYDSAMRINEILFHFFSIAGIPFTIIYLLLDRACCCARSQKCFCKSCCGPECYKTNIRVIDVSHDELKIVHIDN